MPGPEVPCQSHQQRLHYVQETQGRAPLVAVELVEQVEAAALLAEPHALVVAHDGADLQVELADLVPLVVLLQVPQLRVAALDLRAAKRGLACLSAGCFDRTA